MRKSPDRHRRSQRAHPHVQLPAGPRHRPPHQPDAVQDRPIMDGDLDELTGALAQEYQAEQLAALAATKPEAGRCSRSRCTRALAGDAAPRLREFVADDFGRSLPARPRSARDEYIGDGTVSTRDESPRDRGVRPLSDALSRARRLARVAARHRRLHRLVHAEVLSADSTDVEVGYRLLHDAWGQGFATEGAPALVDYGFDDLGLYRIIGVTHRATRRRSAC